MVVLSALFTACTGNHNSGEAEPVSPTPVEAAFAVASRAPGTTKDPEASEMIHQWWVAFVDASGNVTEIATRPADTSTPVEEELFKTELKPGSYTAYAFANISREQIEEMAGVRLVKGAKMSGDPAKAVLKGFDADALGKVAMPMSGYLNFTVAQNASPATTHDIEVVRMYAKIELEFLNESSAPMTIDSWCFSPVYTATAPLPLMPVYTTLGDKPLESDGGTTMVHTNTPHTSLEVGGSAFDVFYTREIISDHTTGNFVLTVETSAGDTSSRRHSLAYELTYINRNDWIRIPVILTDWIIEMDVRFYPPIGGYPAVVVDQNNDEFYATFGTQGRFSVTPRARKNDTAPYEAVTVTAIETTGDDIFTTGGKPAIDPVTGEITGEMSSATGNAIVTLTFRVAADTNVSHIITRKFHIIRK